MTRNRIARPLAPRIAGAVTVLALGGLLAGCGEDPLPDQALAPAASDSAAAPSGTPAVEVVDGEVRDDEAELDLEDQQGDGSAVRVEEAGTTRGASLVVLTRDGEAAPVGVVAVPEGVGRDLTITLADPVSGDLRFRAVLYADVDGDGAFDPEQDAVVVDDDGEPETDDADYRVG